VGGVITSERLQHFILREDVGIEPILHHAENGDWFYYCYSNDLAHHAKLVEKHPQIETVEVAAVDYKVHRITLRFVFVPRIDYFGSDSANTDFAQLRAYGRKA
jgi:hypothetical protein